MYIRIVVAVEFVIQVQLVYRAATRPCSLSGYCNDMGHCQVTRNKQFTYMKRPWYDENTRKMQRKREANIANKKKTKN